MSRTHHPPSPWGHQDHKEKPMNTLTTYYDFLHTGIEYNLNLAGVGTRD